MLAESLWPDFAAGCAVLFAVLDFIPSGTKEEYCFCFLIKSAYLMLI
jgi:hypothetical protein